MFKVDTAEGPRFLVMLTGPRSYTLNGRRIARHETLTVTDRTRKYLLSTGMFSDYDPTPAMPPERNLPPQFGGTAQARFDASDFAGDNPPLNVADAMLLAEQSAANAAANAESEEAPRGDDAPRAETRRGGVSIKGATPKASATPVIDAASAEVVTVA